VIECNYIHGSVSDTRYTFWFEIWSVGATLFILNFFNWVLMYANNHDLEYWVVLCTSVVFFEWKILVSKYLFSILSGRFWFYWLGEIVVDLEQDCLRCRRIHLGFYVKKTFSLVGLKRNRLCCMWWLCRVLRVLPKRTRVGV
jgi:hypothetical protein